MVPLQAEPAEFARSLPRTLPDATGPVAGLRESRGTVFLFEVPGTIFFAPPHDVASLTPEWKGRWRVVLKDGTQGTIPYEPGPGPWVELGVSFVNPAHLQRTADGRWQDPKGFFYPGDELPSVAGPEPDPSIPELPCRPEQVIALHPVRRTSHCRWETDAGDFEWDMPPAKAASLHPSMVLLKGEIYLNGRRLRRVERVGNEFHLTMDTGRLFTIAGSLQYGLAPRFGLSHFNHL